MSGDVRELAAGTAERLRAVLAAVDAGELEAETDQAAYLLGAAEALERLSTSAEVDRPAPITGGCPGRS